MNMTTFPPVPKRSATRISTTLVFFMNGMALSLFFSNIPVFQAALKLSESQLGTALSLQGFGMVLFTLVGSVVAIKFSNRNTMFFGSIMFLLAGQYLAGVGSLTTFTLAIFILGAANSFIDVSMNAHASIVEREYGHEIMSTFHSAYNFGGFAGAILSTKLIDWKQPLSVVLGIAGVGMIGIILLGWKQIGQLHAVLDEGPQNHKPFKNALTNVLKSPAVLILGSMVALALFTENAINGWSSVYLSEVSKSLSSEQGQSFSAYAFAIFSLAMAIGRLLGGVVISRLGAHITVLFCGLLGVVGVLVMVLLGTQSSALIGFGLIGLGLANCIPMFFSRAAAAMPSTPALGIALVNTLGYVGYIAGPLLLGLVAEASSLKMAFMLVLGAMLLIAINCRIMLKLKASAQL